jgi:hypothetical protein
MSSKQQDSSSTVDSSKIPRTADTSPATWFDPTEVSKTYWESDSDWHRTKRESYYKHLAALHQGRKVAAGRHNDRYYTYTMNRDLIRGLSSQLGLTEEQRHRAEQHFHQFNLNNWGVRAEWVAYALCQYIVHSDDDDVRDCHPSSKNEDVPEAFGRVQNSIRFHPDRMYSLYEKVRRRLSGEEVTTVDHHDGYEVGTVVENRPFDWEQAEQRGWGV